MTRFAGLTWDHPRGYDALARAALYAPGLISWDRHALEGFESTPIEDICARYDVVVLDHPHLGDALAASCLRPLDELIAPPKLAQIRQATIGPCFDSYVMEGRPWALPLDAAAQVSAARPDMMREAIPRRWADMPAMARVEAGFTLSLAGPHAFVTLLSMCASANAQFGAVGDGLLLAHHDPVIALFCELLEQTHPMGLCNNPIGILEAMATGDGPTYCPLIFGYVTYASRWPNPVVFGNAPRVADGPPRAVLGGTGIAITWRCTPDAALLAHLTWLLSAHAQMTLVPEHSGQPSATAAWASPAVNHAAHQFYANTRETLQHAFVRPRTPGFVPAANRASAWLRELRGRPHPPAAAVRARLNALLLPESRTA